MIPYGSILNDVKLSQASQSWAEATEATANLLANLQATPPSTIPGSILTDLKISQATQGWAEAAEATANLLANLQATPPSSMPGSVLADPKVTLVSQGLEESANAAARLASQVGLSPGEQPLFGSTLTDGRVAQALQQESQPAQVTALAMVKNALNGGELAPEMQCRYDLPRYQLGCESVLNMIPLPGGGLTKRPGLKYVGNAGQEWGASMTGRLIPWRYSEDQQLMLMILTRTDMPTLSSIYWIDRSGNYAPVDAGCRIPHCGKEIFELTCCQVGKYIYLAHANRRPGRLCVEPAGQSYNISWENLRYSNHYLDRPEIASIETEGGSSTADPVRLRYVVTAIDAATGEESLPGDPYEAEYAPPQAQGYHWVINITPIEGFSEYRVYRLRGGEYGFIGRVMAPAESFEDYNYAPDTTDRPPEEQVFFTRAGDYPSLVFLHQQRLGYAASLNDPLTLWLSQASNFQSFSAKIPPTDEDGIEVTLASAHGNKILWAVSDRTGLAIGTEGDEWFLTGANGEGAISPNSLSFQPQTSYGSRPGIMPLRCNSSLLFVQAGGRCIRDLGYSFQSDRYEARDLTLLSHHLFVYNRVTAWAWQEAPANILWCVLNSGKLIGLTYMPEQEVIAWHRQETAGKFLSCATMEDYNGNSRVWFVVRRSIPQAEGGEKVHHCIEIMDCLFEGLPTEWDTQTGIAIPLHVDGINAIPVTASVIPCLPEAGLQNGTSALIVKKINAIKARVINSAPFKAQVSSQNTEATSAFTVPYPSPTPNARLASLSWATACDWPCNLGAGFRENPKLKLILDGPAPATILGLAIEMEVASQSLGQV